MGNIEYKFGDEVSDPDVEQVRGLSRSLIQSFFGDPQSEDFGGRSEDEQEIQDWIGARTDQLMGMVRGDDVVVAMDEGRIVGVGGVNKCGEMEDGRAILQIVNASVLPSHRGKKVGMGMFKRGMERIEEKYPGAVLVGFSRNDDIVVNGAKARGYMEVSYDEYQRLTGQAFSSEDLARFEKDGYVALVKDPLRPTSRMGRIVGGVRAGVALVKKKMGR